MDLRQSILKVLAYFDLFDYPLTKEEIFLFLDQRVDANDLKTSLSRLATERIIFKFNDFYSLKNESGLLKKRIDENNYAQTLLTTARRISKFLFRFPYIKGVGISGSLSKNVANEESDIDYFIITTSNRLWIARTITHLFKKFTFITGHQHWYCMNYYVDEAGLQIEEKNIFTATELLTLVPVCGNGTMQKFFKENDWARIYFPNYKLSLTNPPTKTFHTGFRKLAEFFFNNKFGDWLDNYLMQVTKKRWKKKEEKVKLNIKGNRMGLNVGKHFCKPNPAFFHASVLSKYAARLNEIEKQLSKANASEKYFSLAKKEV
ncbi:MAG: hypothetical protein JST75_06265 [Bacteroidetes bacterium]|nr:hypothetical protein [Bacteroidota bacterium]